MFRMTSNPEVVSRRLCLKKLEEGMDWATRRSGTGRPEGRRVFELERVVSCRSADLWWRTKLNFGSGEPFDDLHRSTAFRAAPKIGTVFGGTIFTTTTTLMIVFGGSPAADKICTKWRNAPFPTSDIAFGSSGKQAVYL